MHKGSSWILRLYFAVIAAITLVTLMYGAIDLLATGLKTYVITAADVPDYIENCSTASTRYPQPVATKEYTPPTPEQITKECEARNLDAVTSYQRMKASNAVRNLALILIASPLFALHFRFVYRDWIEEHKSK